MKILNLKAENIKKLVAVDITPDADTVIITGKNGAGKSSVLDSIFWALGGTKNIQDKPIRDGQETAFVKLDLGRLKVERTFTAKGTYLKVTAEDGAKYGNGQEMLNKLLGAITFDPLEFSRMARKEQFDTLRRLVAPDLDIEALDAANKKDFDRRTEINRAVESAKAVVIQLEQDTAGEEPETVDVMELVESIDKAKQIEDTRADYQRMKTQNEEALPLHGAKIMELESKIAEIRQLVENCKGNIETCDAQIAKLPAPVDVAPLKEKLSNAQALNAKAQTFKASKERLEFYRGEHKKNADIAAELTTHIESRKKQKEEAISAAKLPIEGLAFVDGTVQLNGHPFDQASSAEQLRASTAIAISMNPELRVIRIKDGSLLDREGLEMVKAMAKDGDFQIWLEAVESDDPVAIVIEDGHVQGAPPAAAAEESAPEEPKKPAVKGKKADQGNLI